MIAPRSLLQIALTGLAACGYPALPQLGPGSGSGMFGEPVKLAFLAPPTRGVALEPFDPIHVAITDADGNTVPDATGQIMLALGANPSGANLLGVLTVKAAAGVARFVPIGVDKSATGYTLVASASGLASATSPAFDAAAPAFTLISTGIYGGPVNSVTVSPAVFGARPVIFAGLGNGVYKSVNDGATWTPASFGFATAAGTLVADPKNPGVVYAVAGIGGGRGVVSGTPYFLKRTGDSGVAWLDLDDAASPDVQTNAVAVDPMNPQIIYVAGSKLHRSVDGGATWSVLGFPFTCLAFAIDPITPTSLYCSAYDSSTQAPKGIYKSIDSGANWAAVNGANFPSVDTRGFLLAAPYAVFANAGTTLFRSANAGGSWTSLSITFAQALSYAPSMPTRMYLSEGSPGVAVSNDAGATFGAPVSVGDVVQGLAVDPTNPDVVYAAGRDNGVYVSTNGGASWSFSSIGIATHLIHSVAMAPSVPSTVLVSANNGVFQTSNGGTSWTQSSTLGGIVQFEPSSATRAYLCGNSFATSTNSGASFGAAVATGTGCAQLALSGATFVAAGFPGGVHKSSNSGSSWAATGLAANFAYGVAFGSADGTVVVAGTNQGVYRSADGGASFMQISLDLATSLLADPASPSHVIAGLECGSGANGAISNGGFRISGDGGATFGSVIPGPCVAQLSDNGSLIFAAGRPFSAVSADHGAHWTPIGGSIPDGVEMTSIAASADGNTVYLGTTAGLYKSTSGGL